MEAPIAMTTPMSHPGDTNEEEQTDYAQHVNRTLKALVSDKRRYFRRRRLKVFSGSFQEGKLVTS